MKVDERVSRLYRGDIMKKKYLIPYDGSQHSNKALNVANLLASKTGGEATLFSVVEVHSAFDLLAREKAHEILSKNRDLIEERQKTSTDSLADTNYEITGKTAMGDPATEVLEEAKDGYNLIVVGSRGLSAMRRAFLGSVSDKIVRKAGIDTLVVEEYNENVFDRLLVPIDGSETSKKALTTAMALGELFNSEIHILYVISAFHIPELDTAYSLEEHYQPYYDELAEKVLTEAKEMTSSYPGTVITHQKAGNIIDSILELEDEIDPSTIIVGSRGLGRVARGLVGSVSSGIVHNSHKNVLIVH